MLAPALLRIDALFAVLVGAALVMTLLRAAEAVARQAVTRADQRALARALKARGPGTTESSASSRRSST